MEPTAFVTAIWSCLISNKLQV